MSALSEQNRAAIYGALAGDAALMMRATGGIHFLVAPSGTTGAFIVFSRVPASVNYALGNNLVYEDDLWLIKAIVPDDLANDKGASEFAEEILTQSESALAAPFALTGAASIYFRREKEMPPFIEELSDVAMHHHGAFFRAVTSV